MNRLRQALGDSADNPHYIETLARRGYRWKVPVEWREPPQPIPPVVVALPARPTTEGLIGKRVSHYRVLEVLGGGGMGVVYKAEDMKLGRRVALKFLPEELATEAVSLQRFEREARAASALDHPNICTIYEFGEHEGKPFIVMQLLDGQTLRERIDGGTPLACHELLDLAIQIAEGLDAAHQNGIIHRDIKPANVFITKRGEAKILDFGLAKIADLGEQLDSAPGLTDEGSPQQRAINLTLTGKSMGTASYMSPEQVQGEKLDARTDLFSFGLVLYELATAHRPFPGETATVVHDAILQQRPTSARELNPELPSELEEIINKCLEKDRQARYQTAAELLGDLKGLKRDSEPLQVAAGRRRVVWIVALAMLGAALIGGWRLLGSRTKSTLPPLRLVPVATNSGTEGRPAFSPDGDQIAFMWNGGEGENFDIYVKLIGEGTPPLQVTKSAGSFAAWPVWSPDGHRIAFFRCTDTSRGVFVLPAQGGPERRIAEPRFCPGDLDWSPDGRLLTFSDKDSADQPDSIFLVSLETGDRRRLTIPARLEQDREPKFSPDGKTVAFVRAHDLIVGDIFLVSVDGGEPRRLTVIGGDFAGLTWTPDGGEIIFAATSREIGNNALWRIKASGGTPQRIAEVAAVNASEPTVSRKGNRLAYRHVTTNSNIWQIRLPILKRRPSAPVKLVSSTRLQDAQQYSPDGKKIVFGSDRSGGPQIWVCDSDGSNPIQLTFMNAPNVGTPRWSPDGQLIAFDSTMSGNSGVYLVRADGGTPRPLVIDSHFNATPSFSRDGSWVYFVSDRSGEYQVWKIASGGGEPAQVTFHGGFFPMESPDGRFLYYMKDSEPLPPSRGHLWRMPLAGGAEQLAIPEAIYDLYWALSPGGIYFIDPDSKPRPTLKFFDALTGRIAILTTLEKQPSCCGQALTISPDGRSILYGQEDSVTTDIMLVENFR
jgi:Tol biopolymer transport system component/tRNA A-37 threonylcarbamoyl transferase component Bud32